MARKPMVTRTFQTTKATVLCLNIAEQKTETVEVVLPRTYKDEKATLKAVTAEVNTNNIKAVHIVSTKIIETLYGMPETDFIAHAKVLPNRGTKKEGDN